MGEPAEVSSQLVSSRGGRVANPPHTNKGGRMWIRSTYRALWLALLLCCVLGPGCSLDEAEANVRGAKKKIENLTPYVPTSHTYIPVGISALCTAALAVIRIIKEWNKQKNKKE